MAASLGWITTIPAQAEDGNVSSSPAVEASEGAADAPQPGASDNSDAQPEVESSEEGDAAPSDGTDSDVSSSTESSPADDSVSSDAASTDGASDESTNGDTEANKSDDYAGSWDAVPGFSKAYRQYVTSLASRLSTVCGGNAQCAIGGLHDNGTVSISSGYKGTFTSQSANGIIAATTGAATQSATTYTFRVSANQTGKFAIKNTSALSGTRPSFIMAASGPFSANGAQSNYIYAGYLGDQRNGQKFAQAGDFSSWINTTSGRNVTGDQFLGKSSISLCGNSFCRNSASAEGNWLYFNNTTSKPITVNLVLTAQAHVSSNVKLSVSYSQFKNGDVVPVYRVYNRPYGKHHYTASLNEYRTLVRRGWQNEGTSFYASKTGKPVYRVYNRTYRVHHYTASAGEYRTLVKRGWRDEGIAFYTSNDGLRDVYRLYNNVAREHLFTSYNEYRSLGLREKDWQQENIAWSSLR